MEIGYAIALDSRSVAGSPEWQIRRLLDPGRLTNDSPEARPPPRPDVAANGTWHAASNEFRGHTRCEPQKRYSCTLVEVTGALG